MPQKIEDFTKGNGRVDFGKYANGDVYQYFSRAFAEAENLDDWDYDSEDQSFAGSARNWGRNHGYHARADRVKPGLVEVRFVNKEQE